MLDKLFLQMLNMSFTAGFVIMVVLLVRMLLKKAPKIFSYIIWSVVLFRLICPFSFESTISFIPVKADPIPADIGMMEIPNIDTGIEVLNNSINPVLPQATVTASINPMQIWLFIGEIIWIIGIIVLLIYSLVSLISLIKKLRAAEKIEMEEDVYSLNGLDTAFVLGFVKPKIYIPLGLSEKEKKYIILHERTHIKRFDHIIRLISFFVLCLYWLNPLVWVAFILAMKDMEISCDESVLKQADSDIRSDYATSLLRFATQQKSIKASPLAFGEGDTKARIKNAVSYKKPAFWVSIVIGVVIICILIGLFANPKTKNITVEDCANLYIEQEIEHYENIEQNGDSIKIIDSKITKLEKIAQFDNLMEDHVEVWQLEYRLKPDDISKIVLAGGMNEIDGWVTDESSMGHPLLVFTYKTKQLKYLGNMWSGDGANGNIETLAGQEILTRVFLEDKGLIPNESYEGEHAIAEFIMSTGETGKLLLSKPIKQGKDGIWCVERWMDGNGTVYYEVPRTNETPGVINYGFSEIEKTEKGIEDYYAQLQELSKEDTYKWLRDAKIVALDYINNVLNQPYTIEQLKLEIKEDAKLEKFYETPTSEYIGYISNFLKDGKTFFYLDRVEWLSGIKDSDRLKELGIDPLMLDNGYYIYNPATYPDFFQTNEKSKFYIIDWGETLSEKEVSLEQFKEFIDHLEKVNSNIPFRVTTKDGYVKEIREQYIP